MYSYFRLKFKSRDLLGQLHIVSFHQMCQSIVRIEDSGQVNLLNPGKLYLFIFKLI